MVNATQVVPTKWYGCTSFSKWEWLDVEDFRKILIFELGFKKRKGYQQKECIYLYHYVFQKELQK